MKDKSEMEKKILASPIDHTTKVHLFKILDRGASPSETFLIETLIGCSERYKKPEISVDSRVREEFNQP